MDLKTALKKFIDVNQSLKPKKPLIISKEKKAYQNLKKANALKNARVPIKPIYSYNHNSNVSIQAVLKCSKGYDFQKGV